MTASEKVWLAGWVAFLLLLGIWDLCKAIGEARPEPFDFAAAEREFEDVV